MNFTVTHVLVAQRPTSRETKRLLLVGSDFSGNYYTQYGCHDKWTDQEVENMCAKGALHKIEPFVMQDGQILCMDQAGIIRADAADVVRFASQLRTGTCAAAHFHRTLRGIKTVRARQTGPLGVMPETTLTDEQVDAILQRSGR